MISSTYSRLWKMFFEIIVSKIRTNSHIKLEGIRIENRRDRLFVVDFLRLEKVDFVWFSNGTWIFSSNIEPICVKVSKKMYLLLKWAIDMCPKIEELMPEYKCTKLTLTKIDLKLIAKKMEHLNWDVNFLDSQDRSN